MWKGSRTAHYSSSQRTWSDHDACLLIEVLSPSTANNDRRDKYRAYTELPSLQTYLIVSQSMRHVVEYQRQGDEWIMREHWGKGVVNVPCLGLSLSMEQIYGRLVPE